MVPRWLSLVDVSTPESIRLVSGKAAVVCPAGSRVQTPPEAPYYKFRPPQNYKFMGKSVSQTTGLYYYGTRWYDPSIGRFISPDPRGGGLSNPQSFNPYAAILNSPTTYADPDGAGPVYALSSVAKGSMHGYKQ